MGGIVTNPRNQFWCALRFLLLLLLIQTSRVFCYQYDVGGLDCWGIPPSANPQVYLYWTKNITFQIGDSLFFLYPPSQDSVIQVTEESFGTCNIKDPILTMNNGNSLFNVTSPGNYYFTSGAPGHCEQNQKLYVYVPGNGVSYAYPPNAYPPNSDGPIGSNAPYFPIGFGPGGGSGSIPIAPYPSPASASLLSSSSPSLTCPVMLLSASIGFLIWALH